jgi:hypothetical protein
MSDAGRTCATCKHLDYVGDCPKLLVATIVEIHNYGRDGYGEVVAVGIDDPGNFYCSMHEDKQGPIMSEPYTPEELAAMRATAEAATNPDRWRVEEHKYGAEIVSASTQIVNVESSDELGAINFANLEHIATFDPRAVLRLLGDIQRMNGEAIAYRTRIAERDAEILSAQRIAHDTLAIESKLRAEIARLNSVLTSIADREQTNLPCGCPSLAAANIRGES